MSMGKAKALMVQGTMSNAGKSLTVAGICRYFTRRGLRVAPFKSQNMALNSFITEDGLEMGRAQVMQAEACGIAPDARMNPILLKPEGDEGSQVIVNGEVRGSMKAVDYARYRKSLVSDVKRAFDSLASENDLIVISDEIYSELTYTEDGHTSIASLPGMHERTVVLNGFSKAFAMTGWRMGYLCAPAAFTDVMCKIHQYTILCAPRQGQVAAEEALRQGREDGYHDVLSMRESYDQRRRLMVQSFRDMGLSCFEPLGAFYVFPGIRKTGLSSEEFCQRLLSEKKVVTVPGTAFGASGEGYIRCSYATGIAKLTEALSRMADFVSSL